MPPSSKKRWRCDVCAMSMDLGLKDQHLSGKKHRKKEFSAAMRDCSFTCEDCAVTVPLGQMDAHLQSKKHIRTISSWKCEICARDVLLVEKDMHLSSKAHAKALKRTATTVIKPRAGLASPATGLLAQPTEITAALASLEISDTDTSWAGRARVPETFIPQGRIVKFSAPSRPIRTLNKREAPREAAKPRQKTVQKPAVRTRKDKTNRKRKAVKKRGLIDQKIVFTGPPTISTFLPNPKQLRPSPTKVPKINDVWKCGACCESMKLKEKSGHVDGSDHLVKNVISRENGRQELKKRRAGDERDFREDVLNYKRAKFEHSADAVEEDMF